MTDKLLWIDLETTGSDEEKGDCIIEVGCILTDSTLIAISEFESVVKPEPLGLGRMYQNDVVREMHNKNGLVVDLMGTNPEPIHKVTKRLLAWLEANGAVQGHVALAGSGVGHFDSRFVRKYMPQLASFCRYWVIDVGTIRRAHEMWVGTTVSSANDGKTHRALDDIRCHLTEAREFASLWAGQTRS